MHGICRSLEAGRRGDSAARCPHGQVRKGGGAAPMPRYYPLAASSLAIHSRIAVSAPPILTARLPCIRTPRPCSSSQVQPNSKPTRSEEHTSELQSRENLVCRLLLEKK